MLTRRPDGNLYEVRDSYINVASFEVEGVDFEATYHAEVSDLLGRDGDFGRISLQGVASYLKHNIFIDRDVATGEETAFDYAGEAANPQWRGMLNAGYYRGPIQVNWSSRFVDCSASAPLAQIWGCG